MKLPHSAYIDPAQAPILILLTIAAAGCLLLIAELRARLTHLPKSLPKKATPRARLAASLPSLAALTLASVALFVIGGLIGLNFGLFWLIVCGALALMTIFVGFGNPRLARATERIATGRLTVLATAVVVVSIALAFAYEAAIHHAGFTLR